MRVWGVAIFIAALGILIATQWIGAAPPRKIILASGPQGGAYASLAAGLRAQLSKDILEIEIRPTRGSVENLRLLEQGEVDLAFVQGGSTSKQDAEQLVSLGSVGIEAVWIFGRQASSEVEELRGKRVAVGEKGSGSRPVALQILHLAGLEDKDLTLLASETVQSIDMLRTGACDALILVSSAQAASVKQLMHSSDSGVQLLSLARARAYTRHAKYLREVELSPGMFDIAAKLPPQPVQLVATTSALVARKDFHEALAPLLLEAAGQLLADGGLFEDEGEFPNAKDLSLPLAKSARDYYAHGRSWLYRRLPFRLAALLDRLKILLLPLITLLFPLIRLAPPVYRWRVRRRIFLWYADLLDLEGDLREEKTNPEAFDLAFERLDLLQREITGVRVPLSYAEELYNFRMHVRQVREDLYRTKREQSS